jgi:hypothetical protein
MARPFVVRLGASFAGAALVLSLGAGAALAGEITGNGRSLEVVPSPWGMVVHGKSLCAYSGLNDEITAEEPGRVQNWGTIPKAMRDIYGPLGFHPGMACNPNIGLEEG